MARRCSGEESGLGFKPRPPCSPSRRRATGSTRSPRARSPSRSRTPASGSDRPRRARARRRSRPRRSRAQMIGHARLAITCEGLGDRLGLAALLGADAGVRARRVDEAQNRRARSATPAASGAAPCGSPRARHAEVAVHVLLGVAALLVAEHQDLGQAVELRQAADDRRVVVRSGGRRAARRSPRSGARRSRACGPPRVPRQLDPLPSLLVRGVVLETLELPLAKLRLWEKACVPRNSFTPLSLARGGGSASLAINRFRRAAATARASSATRGGAPIRSTCPKRRVGSARPKSWAVSRGWSARPPAGRQTT